MRNRVLDGHGHARPSRAARLHFTCLVAALTALPACGGSAEPAPQAPAAAPRQAQREVEPAPLTPVPEPEGVFLVARLTDASRVADMVAGLVGLPMDWRTLLSKQAPAFSKAIALGSPVEVVAMFDPASTLQPRPWVAYSVGASSMDAALELVRSVKGQVTSSGPDLHVAELPELGAGCVIGRALGSAPVRVVCGRQQAAVEALQPYMTRTLPTLSLGTSDLQVRLRAAPLQARWGRMLPVVRTALVPRVKAELAVDHPALDDALDEALYGVADEVVALAGELDTVDLDLSLGAQPRHLALRLKLALKGQQSWSAKGLVSLAARAQAAPDAFWALPGDALQGSFCTTSEPAHLAPVAHGLSRLARAFLEYKGVAAKPSKDMADALDALLQPGGGVLHAQYAPTAVAGDTVAARFESALPSHLFGFQADDGRVGRGADALLAVLKDRKLLDALAAQAAPLGKLQVQGRAPRAAQGLPAKSRVLELSLPVPKGPQGPQSTLRLFALIAPAPSITWLAIGPDERQLASRVAEAVGGKGTATLRSRSELSAQLSQPHAAAGFASLAGLLVSRALGIREALGLPPHQPGGAAAAPGRGAAPGTSGAAAADSLAQRLAALLASMPHQGRTPILWSATAGASGPTLSLDAELDEGTLEDLAAAGKTAAAAFFARGMPGR